MSADVKVYLFHDMGQCNEGRLSWIIKGLELQTQAEKTYLDVVSLPILLNKYL